MGEPGVKGPAEPTLTAAEKQQLLRRQQLDRWNRNAPQLRRRNILTGLTIGAFVLGMFSYTILTVKQEKVMEELDDEARTQIFRGPRTGANS